MLIAESLTFVLAAPRRFGFANQPTTIASFSRQPKNKQKTTNLTSFQAGQGLSFLVSLCLKVSVTANKAAHRQDDQLCIH